MYNLMLYSFYSYILFSLFFCSLYILSKLIKFDRHGVAPITTAFLLVFYLQFICIYWWKSITISYYLIFLKLGVFVLYLFSKHNPYRLDISYITLLSFLLFLTTAFLLHMSFVLLLIFFEFFSLFLILLPSLLKKKLQKEKVLSVSFLLVNMFFIIFINKLISVLDIKFINVINFEVFFFSILFFIIFSPADIFLDLDRRFWSYYFYVIDYITDNQYICLVGFFKFISSGVLCWGIIIFNFFDYNPTPTILFLFGCLNLVLLMYFFCFFCLLNEKDLDWSWNSYIHEYYKYIKLISLSLIVLITGICNYIIWYDIVVKCGYLLFQHFNYLNDLQTSVIKYSSWYHYSLPESRSIGSQPLFGSGTTLAEKIKYVELHYFTKWTYVCYNDVWLVNSEDFFKENIVRVNVGEARPKLRGVCLNLVHTNPPNSEYNTLFLDYKPSPTTADTLKNLFLAGIGIITYLIVWKISNP